MFRNKYGIEYTKWEKVSLIIVMVCMALSAFIFTKAGVMDAREDMLMGLVGILAGGLLMLLIMTIAAQRKISHDIKERG